MRDAGDGVIATQPARRHPIGGHPFSGIMQSEGWRLYGARGCNPWQSTANRLRPEGARTSQTLPYVRDQLPEPFRGKEGPTRGCSASSSAAIIRRGSRREAAVDDSYLARRLTTRYR